MASEAKPKPEVKAHKEKKAKTAAEEPTAAVPKPPPPRQPSDPRLKILKQFRGKLLPRGVLRDRYTALMQRWDSSDHGGVTVEELKSLFDDRKSAREKSSRRRQA